MRLGGAATWLWWEKVQAGLYVYDDTLVLLKLPSAQWGSPP